MDDMFSKLLNDLLFEEEGVHHCPTNLKVDACVLNKLDAFNKDMDYLKASIYKTHPDFNISTLTILVRLSQISKICDIYRIEQLCGDNDHIKSCLGAIKDRYGFDEVEIKASNSFYNSITFCFVNKVNKNKKAVKLFVNGLLHITGCKSIYESLEIASYFSNILDVVFSYSLNTISVSDFTIQLINSNFYIGFGLNLGSLYKLISKKANIHVYYDVEIHMGINVKYVINESETITLILFHTGNVLIMGTKKPLHLLEAYNYIIEFINSNISSVRCDSHMSNRKKASFDYGHYIELK